MMNKILFSVVTLAMFGCASNAPQDDAEIGSEVDATTQGRDMGAAGAPSIAPVSPDADVEVEMTALTLPVALLGQPGVGMSVCATFQMPVRTDAAANGQMPGKMDFSAKNDSGCAHDDGGLLQLAIASHTQTALLLRGPGFFPFMVQVTSNAAAQQMSPLRLLTDDALAAVYANVETPIDALHTTAVIETPADDASVEMLVNGTDEGPSAIYLDAAGIPTVRNTSVVGGWAVFANVPIGIHNVFMSHATLTCTPETGASWPGSNDASASIITLQSTVSHSNAFGCR
jgi:hypothetical protein